MRYFTIIFLLLIAQFSFSQQSINDILKNTDEIIIRDSILFNYDSVSKMPLDDLTGQSLLWNIYHDTSLYNQYRNYGVAGKITSCKDFDILIFSTGNSVITKFWQSYSRSPMSWYLTNEVFFLLYDKNGSYKNSFLIAMSFINFNAEEPTKKEITSWVYNDFKILQQIKIEHEQNELIVVSSPRVKKKPINFLMEYRINDYGVFVSYPKFKSN